MTTATKLTPGDVLEQLEELLAAAVERAAAEAKAERIAATLLERDGDYLHDAIWQLEYMREAAAAQVEAACSDATTNDAMDPLHRCQTIQDAIYVLRLAIGRSADAS